MARADYSVYGTFIRVLKKVGPQKKFAIAVAEKCALIQMRPCRLPYEIIYCGNCANARYNLYSIDINAAENAAT